MPTLRRIGFTDEIGTSLLGTGWQSLHAEGVALMHPACTKRLTEVRRGVVEQATERSRLRHSLDNMPLVDRDIAARTGSHPVYLRDLLANQSVSWVVLPRVYDHLEEGHACHLQHYARAMNNENEPAFQRLLARVLVEFIGNYSVKYGGQEWEFLEALFHGYEALFWRSLRSPPPESENLLTFDGFLFWTANVQRRLAPGNEAMRGAVAQMQHARNKVFPAFDTFGRSPARNTDMGWVALSLRHGAPGVEAALQEFALSPLSETETLGRLPVASVPTMLSALYRHLTRTYPSESRNTRGAIRAFFEHVRNQYQLPRLRETFPSHPLSGELRFVARRVTAMCRAFAASLGE